MSRIEPGGFRGITIADRRTEAPWEWSAPRVLNPSRSMALELEDGQLLDSVMDRVAPSGSPLEGSVLSFIFNPLLIAVGTHPKIKGWTDFAGGGMAVLEDRFSAGGYFEFRAFECPRAVDLLYTLRTAIDAGASLATTRDVMAVIIAAEEAWPHASRDPGRGPLKGWSDLLHAWEFQRRLDRIRRSRGLLWPQSHLELREWIMECTPSDASLTSGVEAPITQALGELALRRFPEISR